MGFIVGNLHMGWIGDLEAFAAALLTPEGPLDNFIVKLGCGSRCSEAGRAFLGQGL